MTALLEAGGRVASDLVGVSPQQMEADRQEPRIQIVNWRRHGDDESYAVCEVLGPGAPDLIDLIEKEEGIKNSGSAEHRGDYSNVIYVNDDFMLRNGKTMTDKTTGILYRLTLTPMLDVGKRYSFKGPRFNGIYQCMLAADSGYIHCRPSPRPNKLSHRGSFGDNLPDLLRDHVIREVRPRTGSKP